MRRIYSGALIFLLLFVLNGCEYLSSDPVYKTLPIEGNLLFNFSESYENYNKPGIPVIYFNLKTEKEYGCVNYNISTEIRLSGNNLDVYIKGIQEPNICLTAIGPATSSSSLDIPAGNYKLILHDENFSDTYDFSVSDKSITIDQSNYTETKPMYRVNWRYPKNSFVYLCGSLTEDSSICNDFLDTLKSRISLQEFSFPDSGKIPYPTASQGHYYDMPARYFYYKDETDFNKIGEILKNYKDNYLQNKSGYGIQIINWFNKKFYSWLL